ncbi:hypothetical protein K435DRAFT_929295 [Dendrothele bispora CBS 962.96]|uniref:Beta-glucuronidase C-terminal domain-containing protein n=1 Tax=Dendrothele bispora (strain CBS 962.96) TaxID=1314807 RepID=A0A4S8L5Q3_DENBC|nr:hypothetical protein K435DRAFT_929295 [Dendrothele bispora CBS 962.96]
MAWRSKFFISVFLLASTIQAITVPTSPPSNAGNIDKSLVAVSLEFFAFPQYTTLVSTSTCLNNVANLRGSPVAVRIGGTTQDRATYDPNLSSAVEYSVDDPADAPASLNFGPSFFSLAANMSGEVTVGLNRQLNNQGNTRDAAVQAKNTMPNLFAIELGNEPDCDWNQNADEASEQSWFNALSTSVGNIFQGAVYLGWDTSPLVSALGSAIVHVKSISRHSYPQSACGGASTDLRSLMSHSSIVSYTSQFKSGATTTHNAGLRYFLGETNSATCGGGGISPTFGAALWIVDYVLQGALNGVDRLYFHQGTIGNCQYCWWGRFTTGAPFYGVAFVSEFLGTDGTKVAMLDNGTGAVASYVVYNSANTPVRLLVYNSNYYDGTGTRSSTSVTFTGGGIPSSGAKTAKRLTAPNATSRVDMGARVTIGSGGTFDGNCNAIGTQVRENVAVNGGLTVSVSASEALIVYL